MNFSKLATLGVQGLQAYQPGKPIEELEREYGIKNIIKLASNENPLPTSSLVQEAISTSSKDIARYPDGNGFILKQALAEKHKIDQNLITLGNGSNDLLELITRAFVTPEHNVIFSQHAFAVYPIVTQAVGAKAIITPAKNWGHDLNAMQAAITENTKLIFIANPNNPTGTWINKIELENFLDTVPKRILIVLDEAYFEYASENPNYPNSFNWIKNYSNLIVTRTFSKAYGLAGLRVGYSISNPEIADMLNRVRQPFNVNSIALVAATAVLNDINYLKASVAINQKGMQQLTQAFEQMELSYIPSQGNFIAVEVGNGAIIYEKLLRKGIIVRPIGGIYQMPQYLRVSIGLTSENEVFIQAIDSIMKLS
jgi:histidinol-phosphate aminotransferase